MPGPNEEDIRKRAYELWERAGRPDSGHQEFWLEAERELQGRVGTPGETAGRPEGEHADPGQATETDPPAPGKR